MNRIGRKNKASTRKVQRGWAGTLGRTLASLTLLSLLLGSTLYPMKRQVFQWFGKNADFVQIPSTLSVDGFRAAWAYSGWLGPNHLLAPHRSEPPVKDHNLFGGVLKMNGLTFSNGIGVHAPSEIAFELDGKAVRFQGRIGIDESSNEAQSYGVRASVIADGRLLAQTPKLRITSNPFFLDLPVTGVKELILRVDATCLEDLGSNVDWVDLKFIH